MVSGHGAVDSNFIEDRPGWEPVAAQSHEGSCRRHAVGTGANTINSTLFSNRDFNFIRDIAPIAIINSTPYLLVANVESPVKEIPEFISYAKANPGRITVASAGVGTTNHICLELLKMMAGVDLVHVPYRGSFVPDLLGGQVQCAFSTVPQVIEDVRGGKLRARAVTGAARTDALPDVPTIGEFVAGYEADSWFGIVAPRGTSTEIVNELNNKINTVVADPKMKVQLVGLGVSPKSMTPIEFGKLIADYTEKWARVIKFANIKPE